MHKELEYELINKYNVSTAVALDVVNSRNEEEMKIIMRFLNRCGHEINSPSKITVV